MPGSRGEGFLDDAHHGEDHGVNNDELLERGGEQQSLEFAAIVREMAAELTRYVARRSDPLIAEDVVSDVFLVLWRRWPFVPTSHDARRAWIYEVTKRTLKDARSKALRQHRLEERLASVRQDSTGRGADEEVIADAAVEAMLDGIPQAHAQALRLTVVDGLSAREAAEVLGDSATALTTRLARARASARRWFMESERRVRDDAS